MNFLSNFAQNTLIVTLIASLISTPCFAKPKKHKNRSKAEEVSQTSHASRTPSPPPPASPSSGGYQELKVSDIKKNSGDGGYGKVVGTSIVSTGVGVATSSAINATLGAVAAGGAVAAVAATGIGIAVVAIGGAITYYLYQKLKTKLMGMPSEEVANFFQKGETVDLRTPAIARYLKEYLGGICRSNLYATVDLSRCQFSFRENDILKDSLKAYDQSGEEMLYAKTPGIPHILVDRLACTHTDPDPDQDAISREPKVSNRRDRTPPSRSESFHFGSVQELNRASQSGAAK